MTSDTRPRTRAAAIAQDTPTYHTGRPCLNGHTTYRYTRNGECAACRAERNADHRAMARLGREVRAQRHPITSPFEAPSKPLLNHE